MPVFNGEAYLQEALDSILAQTYTDFEVVISDNGSTDRTEDICAGYVTQDSRVRYFRNSENLGAAWNYNHVFGLCSSEFFKWAAHDDVLAPDFLLECVKPLEGDDSVVLSYPDVAVIDAQGDLLQEYDLGLEADTAQPHRRFRSLLHARHRCLPIFGVIRADALQRTPLIGSYVSSDRVLLARLALMGRLRQVPGTLFFARSHPQQSVQSHSDWATYSAWFDPALGKQVVFRHRRLLSEHRAAIRETPLRQAERLQCCLYLGCRFARLWRPLLGELSMSLKRARAR